MHCLPTWNIFSLEIPWQAPWYPGLSLEVAYSKPEAAPSVGTFFRSSLSCCFYSCEQL